MVIFIFIQPNSNMKSFDIYLNNIIQSKLQVIAMEYDELKRKLRNLKKAEERIRFDGAGSKKPYVWDQYFSTKSEYATGVKYPLFLLAAVEKQLFREIIQEYFYSVYFLKYRENGITLKDIYDPELLAVLNLMPGASFNDIKRSFRALAKKYHPDCGGDADKMMEVLEAYHKLLEN